VAISVDFGWGVEDERETAAPTREELRDPLEQREGGNSDTGPREEA
jgi:hypothetical protein